jgi:acyl carrier protein
VTDGAITLDAMVAAIDAFITRERGAMNTPLTADTPLLRSGLVDSMQVFRLAKELAATFGIEVPRGLLVMQDFETPRTIFQRLQAIVSHSGRGGEP